MGKRDQLNKKRKRTKPAYAALTPPESGSSTSDDNLISIEDLETTLYVLQTLRENPDQLSEKYTKDVRGAIWDIHRVMVEGAALGTSLTSKISTALSGYRFTDALIYLFEMYHRRIPPKLGAIQRWVRECDATSGNDGTPGDADALLCLDLILRIANMEEDSRHIVPLVDREVWRARRPTGKEIAMSESVQGVAEDLLAGPSAPFRKVHHVPGPQRKPPNLYDSTVYGSIPGAIKLAHADDRPGPSRHDVPGVPGAFIILDVFTPEECLQIVRSATSVGFEMDEAAEGSARMKSSILARNFVWLADEQFVNHFFSQIRPFFADSAPVQADGNRGGRIRGINRRFRVYQYTENQVYRPHIDGAWPAAGLDPKTGEYLHDSSPPEDPLWSRFTLLVYLNQDIAEGTGCTKFFLPSPTIGTMNTTRVSPIQGAVLCFPHGDTQGSLLHEGSAVGAGGNKYVIRTDLLFEARGYGVYKPPASVGLRQGGKAEEGIGG